jgi:hypothetical protein
MSGFCFLNQKKKAGMWKHVILICLIFGIHEAQSSLCANFNTMVCRGKYYCASKEYALNLTSTNCSATKVIEFKYQFKQGDCWGSYLITGNSAFDFDEPPQQEN